MIYKILVTGGLNFNLTKLCHFTARSVFEYIREGAHCVSQRDILRDDFLESSTPLESSRSRIDLINYYTVIDRFTFRTKAVFEL